MLDIGLRYDLRAPSFGADPAVLYQAAIEQTEWADALGFDFVRLSEHHGSPDGYCPSPLVVAAGMAARTRRLRLRVQAVVLPLHDVLRVAEDVVVADLLSQGRLELVVVAGYVPDEFEMFDRQLTDRARLVEAGMATLRRAWTGEPFEVNGRRAHIALRPVRDGGPPVLLGGSSAAAARRAARIADGFLPTSARFIQAYKDECVRLGRPVGTLPKRRPPAHVIFVSEDPERTWDTIVPHAMHEMNSYAGWLSNAGIEGVYRHVTSVQELRATGVYAVMTPQECLRVCREVGPHGEVELNPLLAGLDPDVGWTCLELFAREVLPSLREDGLTAGASQP